MPQITITISQKVIDRAQVLTEEHNALTGENLTRLQLAGRILRNWAAAKSLGEAVTTVLENFDVDREADKIAAIQAASDNEIATWN